MEPRSGVRASLALCEFPCSGEPTSLRLPRGRPQQPAENYLGLGYAAKTISTLLDRVDPEWILGARKDIQVAVGWESGAPLYIGRLERIGFVPRPVAEASAGLHLQATRWEEYQRQQEQERKARGRHFRHPDGRVWSIGATELWVELRFTDGDGEEHSRRRFREKPDENVPAMAESMVKEQLLEGFVELAPPTQRGA
jgi:hypothetical protein